jgi:hypothetical protein
MDTVAVRQLGDDLAEYVGDVFGSLTYSGWQDRAGHYLRGLMNALARVNPAAASWTLDEVNDGPATATGDPLAGPSEQEMTALIARRDPDGDLIGEPDLPIPAGLWLRRSEQAFLSGLGRLAAMLARHRDGQLVQWGVWLQGGYLTLARSQQQTPPPEVIGLPERRVHLGLGYRGVTSRFPTTDLGRWRYSRKELREQLATVLRRQILPVPADSTLARERLYRLAAFVHDYGRSPAAGHRRGLDANSQPITTGKLGHRRNGGLRRHSMVVGAPRDRNPRRVTSPLAGRRPSEHWNVCLRGVLP